MKKLFFVLCALVLSMVAVHALEVDGVYYELWSQDNWTGEEYTPYYYASVTGVSDRNVETIVIPENVMDDGKKYTVVSIGSWAFESCSNLTTIAIPNTVTEIGGCAFYRCRSLRSITIPSNIIYISVGGEYNTFYGCDALTSIEWNAKDYSEDASSIFSGIRSQITSFTFGESVENIPAYLCSEMNNLQKIDIPANVKSIGNGAFAYCSSLAEINVASGSSFFASIDGVLFNKQKTSLIVYPAGRSARSYAIPSSVKTIEENAFSGCEKLLSLAVPASVTEIKVGNDIIPMWSFSGSTPATIAENVFAENVCLIVNNVDTYKASWPQYASRIFPRQYAEMNLNLTAKTDKSALHMAVGDANLENVIKLTISGTINSYDLMIMRNKMINLRELDLTNASIVANSYEYYTGICSHSDTLLAHSFRGLNSLKLPKTLKYVESAIMDCEGLKYLEINGGVVGDGMATSSSGLEVVLNEGVTEIQQYAFHGKGGLRKITINAPISTIPDNAFEECNNLQEVILPEGLESIGAGAFSATGLVSIVIPASVKSIGSFAFAKVYDWYSCWDENCYYYWKYEVNNECAEEGCTSGEWWDGEFHCYEWGCVEYRENGGYMYSSECSLRKGNLRQLIFASNSQLQSIGEWAFAGCPISGSLNMPEGIENIGEYAFTRCSNLQEVSFSDASKLTTIGIGVFQKCSSLESIRLPQSLQKIRGVAFCESGLKNLTFPNTIKTIEAGAFYGCSALSELAFPTSLQTIGDNAFQGCSSLKEVRVPSTLLSVGDYAFANCDDVTKVYTYTVEPVSINQNTFSCWQNADLYVPTTSYYTYFYNTQWSQFLSLKQFDEEYSYFYINNDYELGGETGTIEGTPNADLNENSGLIITGDQTQEVGVITIAGDDHGAASIIACEGNLQAEELVIRLITKKGNWSYFCFPFDIPLSQLSFKHQYVFKQYDGATRAQYGAGGWVSMVGNVLQKGLGYIFQGAQTDTLEIRIPNPKISCEDYEQIIQAFGANQSVHANWNFIGNPFPSWYDLDVLFRGGFSSPVYIWDAALADYKVYRPGDDEYHFHPYEGFFTQNPDGQDMTIVWSSDGRETKSQADSKHQGNYAPRKQARLVRQQQEERQLIDIRLASANYANHARVVFNANASLGYELGRDAVMMDGGKAPLHIWSIAPDNSRLAINERPYVTSEVALGYDVKEAGYYTLSAARMDKDVILYDNELQQEVDLSLGDYNFYTEAGENTTRFGIRRIKGQEDELTDISATEADEMVNVYTVLGVKLMENVRRADLRLSVGIYLIEHTDGSRSELTIQK